MVNIMVNGFENETKKLTPTEIEFYVPFIASMLKQTNDDKPITNKEIENALEFIYHLDTTSVRIRAMIHYIRKNKLVENVIANSKGYFVTNDIDKLNNYIISLQQRENSIREIRMSFVGFGINTGRQYVTTMDGKKVYL